MYLLSACLLLGCVVLTSHCYQLKNTSCQGSSCYYLYEFIGKNLPWDNSYEACRSEGLEMLRIDSNQTQTLVERLLQKVPQTTQRQVWIGGRRSNDNTWRFMNGTVFNKQGVMEETSPTEQDCLYVRLCKGINPEYQADNCDEKTGASRLLCQYDQIETGRCRSSDVLCGNKCYMKTQYNGNDPNKIDWYNGQTYCSQSDKQGDIAYSYLGDDTLINNIIDLVHPGADCAQLWLGVRRRIWFWKTASTKDEDNQPIDYYNWDDQITENSTQDQCIYIDVDQRNKWQTGLCRDLYFTYYICMKDITTSTARSTTIRTLKTTTGIEPRTVKPEETPASETEISKTTSTVTSAIKPTGNEAENILPNVAKAKYRYKTGFFTLIVVSVILFTIVIIQNVYWMWLRRRMLQKPEVKDNDTHPETDNREESEYEMTGGQNRQMDTSTSPEYIEISTDNNQYERPTVYVNMVDRRKEYESLNG